MTPHLVDHAHTDFCTLIGCNQWRHSWSTTPIPISARWLAATSCNLAGKYTCLFLLAVTSQLHHSRSHNCEQRWKEIFERCRPTDYERCGSNDLRLTLLPGWLGSRVVSVLDSGAEGPGFKSQPRRCRVTALGKLFTPIVPSLTKQRNW